MRSGVSRRWLEVVLSLLVLSAGFLMARHLILSRPRPPAREKKRPVLVVKTLRVTPRPFVYRVETTGTVVAPRRLELASEVAGKVIWVSPRLWPGVRVRKGELLVRIDPTDYRAALSRARARLREAERTLAELSAQARQSVAEWRVLHPGVPPPPLVAKKPELAAARAEVVAAREEVEKARADLARTRIRAPFAARVLEVRVEKGDYASPGRVLAVLYPLAGLEVYAPVADYFLPYLTVPGLNAPAGTPGSPVEVLWEAGPEVFRYHGRVLRVGGEVEEKTRLLPLYLRVQPDPGSPELLPGVFVRIRIYGKKYPRTFEIPPEALVRVLGQTFVWVVDRSGKLVKRPVRVLFQDEKRVVISAGLSAGEKVVAQRLPGALPGMLVRERP
ncbi:efflux RND transporter periplasmic adaptor subunit [Thermosulfurimonas sp.]|uniref:efflux RND transporter periplasmic adaptor subunit n=1 Tax=Thermosulfurimonas sp. TaxID=2080236 RepID=UPI0025FDB4E5|nr:efflux RND transporter periplasmic adaptor subunit [Thermosulfurimonas sp.]